MDQFDPNANNDNAPTTTPRDYDHLIRVILTEFQPTFNKYQEISSTPVDDEAEILTAIPHSGPI